MNYFTIFPYISTSQPVLIAGLDLKPCSHTDGLDENAIAAIEFLKSIFYSNDDRQIIDLVYTVQTLTDEDDEKSYFERILKAKALLAYVYGSPQGSDLNTHIKSEIFTAYTFKPELISIIRPASKRLQNPITRVDYSKDRFGRVDGYKCWIDGRKTVDIIATSRIQPTNGSIFLPYQMDLNRDLMQYTQSDSGHSLISGHDVDEKTYRRVLAAISWYNQSNSFSASEENELISLAIALECLLGLERGNEVTKRFKESVILLTGQADKLKSWLDQFYNARSEIIHDGITTNIEFNAKEKTKSQPRSPYRSLVDYGRVVFRICVSAIISGSSLATRYKLSSLFTTNEERFEILRLRISENDSSISCVSEIIDEIDSYRFVGESGIAFLSVISVLKQVISKWLNSPNSKDDPNQELWPAFLKVKSKIDSLSVLEAIIDNLKDVNQPRSSTNDQEVVNKLASIVWHYCWAHYYDLKRESEPVDTN